MKSGSWELDPSKFLSTVESQRLQAAVKEHAESGDRIAFRDSFIICLGLATGLRVMEISSLKCGDLNLDDSISSLVVTKGKGKKKRRVFFNDTFKKHCKEYLAWKQFIGEPTESESPLFLSSNTGGHLTTRAIQKAFKRCAKCAGLAPRFSIHSLRHTYACFLLKASNWNLRLVQKQLGHSKITTTQIYADVMMPEIKKALDKL
jgi:site-specific recombinase XerD